MENKLIELDALYVRHDKIQSEVVLKHVLHVNQERMVTCQHDILLENVALDALTVLKDNVFTDLFYGV